MTDMASGLGATASCPNCGEQVQVTQVAGAAVTCPACGHVLEAGERDATAKDITIEELIRAFGVNGYDAEVAPAEDGLRCGACGTVSDTGTWAVDDRGRGSSPDGVVAAVRCPSCAAPGTLVLEGADDDDPLVRSLGRGPA